MVIVRTATVYQAWLTVQNMLALVDGATMFVPNDLAACPTHERPTFPSCRPRCESLCAHFLSPPSTWCPDVCQIDPFPILNGGRPGCVCEEGRFRNINGDCVLPQLCDVDFDDPAIALRARPNLPSFPRQFDAKVVHRAVVLDDAAAPSTNTEKPDVRPKPKSLLSSGGDIVKPITRLEPKLVANNGTCLTPQNPDRDLPPVVDKICRLPLDAGRRCKEDMEGRPRLMWHFDVTVMSCRAFWFYGCGGNQNRHDNVDECQTSCKLADWHEPCHCGAEPLLNEVRKHRTCDFMNGCPAGHRCRYGAFQGVCCPNETEAIFDAMVEPNCPANSEVVKVPWGPGASNYDVPIIGTTCSHNFCPADSECIQGANSAFCCRT